MPCFGAHAPNPASASVFAQTPIRRPSEKKSDEAQYEDARWHSQAVGLPFETAKLEGKSRSSMTRRSRRKPGVLSSSLSAAVTSLTSGTFLQNEWPRIESCAQEGNFVFFKRQVTCRLPRSTTSEMAIDSTTRPLVTLGQDVPKHLLRL